MPLVVITIIWLSSFLWKCWCRWRSVMMKISSPKRMSRYRVASGLALSLKVGVRSKRHWGRVKESLKCRWWWWWWWRWWWWWCDDKSSHTWSVEAVGEALEKRLEAPSRRLSRGHGYQQCLQCLLTGRLGLQLWNVCNLFFSSCLMLINVCLISVLP